MAKNDKPEFATEAVASVAPAPVAAVPAPTPKTAAERIALRLGTTVTVQVAEGVELVNNETGHDFVAGQPVQVTVTVTTLRRLQDGDLVLV
jgi:hypothetical protein